MGDPSGTRRKEREGKGTEKEMPGELIEQTQGKGQKAIFWVNQKRKKVASSEYKEEKGRKVAVVVVRLEGEVPRPRRRHGKK